MKSLLRACRPAQTGAGAEAVSRAGGSARRASMEAPTRRDGRGRDNCGFIIASPEGRIKDGRGEKPMSAAGCRKTPGACGRAAALRASIGPGGMYAGDALPVHPPVKMPLTCESAQSKRLCADMPGTPVKRRDKGACLGEAKGENGNNRDKYPLHRGAAGAAIWKPFREGYQACR